MSSRETWICISGHSHSYLTSKVNCLLPFQIRAVLVCVVVCFLHGCNSIGGNFCCFEPNLNLKSKEILQHCWSDYTIPLFKLFLSYFLFSLIVKVRFPNMAHSTLISSAHSLTHCSLNALGFMEILEHAGILPFRAFSSALLSQDIIVLPLDLLFFHILYPDFSFLSSLSPLPRDIHQHPACIFSP